jgi:nitrous oxide reductase accessory protein NosL
MRIFIALFLTFGLIFAAEVESLVGKKYEDLQLNPNLLCPIKNVSISKHKNWLGYIQYNDNTIDPVSSPKYAFRFFQTEALKHFAGIYKLYMTDFKTGKIIDASEAYYVFGSRIMSVGGDDIIPFAKKEDAQAFLDANSGKKIFRFDRMDKNFINYLDLR